MQGTLIGEDGQQTCLLISFAKPGLAQRRMLVPAIREIIGELAERDASEIAVVGGPFEGAKLLLLHTVGAKSGEPRINPLVYLEDGERLVIIASYAGAPKHPPWFHNLRANPAVEIEVGKERVAMRAPSGDGAGSIGHHAVEITYEMGCVAEENGQLTEALTFFSRVLEQDIGFRDVAQKVEQLKSATQS